MMYLLIYPALICGITRVDNRIDQVKCISDIDAWDLGPWEPIVLLPGPSLLLALCSIVRITKLQNFSVFIVCYILGIISSVGSWGGAKRNHLDISVYLGQYTTPPSQDFVYWNFLCDGFETRIRNLCVWRSLKWRQLESIKGAREM